jgi:uncharacterized membrane protein
VQAKWHSYEKGDQSVAQAVGFPAGAVNYMQEIGQESASYGGVILIGPLSMVMGSDSKTGLIMMLMANDDNCDVDNEI